MEQSVGLGFEELAAKESWSAEDVKSLMSQAAGGDAVRRLRVLLQETESRHPDAKGAAALKIGMLRYLLCRFREATESLAAATDNKDRRFYQALCYKQLRQFARAAEEFERARDKGFDSVAVDSQLVEVKALAGDTDGAAKTLKQLSTATLGGRYAYLRGLVDELAGKTEQAMATYQAALANDPNNCEVAFRLAYYLDLHGEEERAIELYKTCITHPPVYLSALMNLAILMEDSARYEAASGYLRRILAANPGHARARLFLKDVEASRTMYYDEDMAKRTAKRNAVLDIPVTDFELSVRARNCLKKMNVRSLGDLVRTSEADLLAYKNFGETSLKEIKDMLTAKGLRLGQLAEEAAGIMSLFSSTPDPFPAAPAKPSNEGVKSIPLAQVEFSIRARKALESLKIATLGDLAHRTEAELLACKNFGQTSLTEIVQRLGEYGLRLREV
ncbi:MAG: tetratricopeptide repeat protein [Phycisphaerae bacterium]|nr:tetratricopeptide repeat protein [Phycisphaerae bacterium]